MEKGQSRVLVPVLASPPVAGSEPWQPLLPAQEDSASLCPWPISPSAPGLPRQHGRNVVAALSAFPVGSETRRSGSSCRNAPRVFSSRRLTAPPQACVVLRSVLRHDRLRRPRFSFPALWPVSSEEEVQLECSEGGEDRTQPAHRVGGVQVQCGS